MTNLQNGVPILGDLLLLSHTYYSIELLVNHFVPEWNVTLSFPLEEDVIWDSSSDEEGWKWAFARQEKFHLVRSLSSSSSLSTHENDGKMRDL